MTPKTLPAVSPQTLALFSTTDANPGAAEQEAAAKIAPCRRGPDQAGAGAHALSREMSLFEIDEALSLLMDSAVEAATENNGEIPAELQQALLDYCEAFGQKVDNIARYIRSQEFEARNASAEIARLEERKAAAEHRVERLKRLVKFFMQRRNIRSMKGVLNTISLRQNSQDSLILTDTSQLPAEFWRVAVVLNDAEWRDLLSHLPQGHGFRERFENSQVLKREPDNARVRAALAGGATLVGAELKRGDHVRLT
jgi:Siphovirus Gp157